MSELSPLLETLVADARAGLPSVLCAVLKTKGSTPQSPGAAMLVRANHSTVGTLGGGCVEAEVRRRAIQQMERGTPALFDFVLDHDYSWDDGLICGGKMEIGVVPIGAGADVTPYETALSLSRRRRGAYLSIRLEHEGRPVEYRVHLEVPPTLLIAGAGHVGQAVARLGVQLDFHVVIIDDRADCASRQRFPEPVEIVVDDIAGALRRYPIDESCYVVIVTRGHGHDHQALEAVIGSEAGYIGLIGSKRKTKMIFSDLSASGATPEQIARVHTPIGVPIGAVTVPEIAVSIAAELIQHRRRRAGKLVEGPLDVDAVDMKSNQMI